MYKHCTDIIVQAAREMTIRNVDITIISETHWTGQGRVKLQEKKSSIEI